MRNAGGILILSFLLASCGGGSSGSAPTAQPTIVNPVIAISDASVIEGDTGTATLSFNVTATASPPAGGSIADASVDFSTNADSADAGSDFTARSGTLLIPSGTTTLTIDIEIVGDTLEEADERLTVTLTNPSNATLSRASAIGTILDDDAVASTTGLDTRPDNQTCIAPPRPTADASVALTDAYPSLPDLTAPTKLLLEPGANPRWFVLQKTGQIITFSPNAPGAASEFLDLNDTRNLRTNSEGGLLGMAFHPNYPTTPEIFLSYTVNHTSPAMRSVISRWVLDDLNNPGAGSREEVLIEINQDFDNHNGGDIDFGSDGFLYIGLGDGGSGNDPRQRAQDTRHLLGAMLRIDIEGTGAGYAIPPDNPFAGNPQCGPSANANDCPEIFAWGLRNPWRWAFDDATDALWLADVGQAAREEVNLIERGGNYGWRCREGDIATSNAADCNAAGTLVEPVTVYGRSDGNSITGGQVYRGTAISELVGRYVFADFGSGRIWAAQPNLQGSFDNDLLINSAISPTAFAIGPDDELYLVNIDGGNGRGRIWRMIAASSGNPDTIAELLSQSGCVSGTDITAPYSGLIPYTLNAPFWSDGALKDRYIGLPNSTTMTIGTDGDIEFPPGTVIVKNFRLGGALIETRHLMRHPDGVWAGYTYEWNAAQTEATRVRGGKTVTINGQDWIYPSGAQCLQCHTQAAGVSLGPEVAQWNRNFAYPATGRNANQLDTLVHVMSFSAPLPAPVAQLDRLASPSDTGASLSDRARAYLHSNCAGCHRVNGPTPSDLDLRYSTPLMATNGCDVRPTGSDLGLTNARLIAPGDASRSTLWERLRRRDTHAMPPVGSTVVDANGVDLIGQWIDSLTTCN